MNEIIKLMMIFFIHFNTSFGELISSTQKSHIIEFWTRKEYSDPNENHLKFKRLDSDTYELIFANYDFKKLSPRLWQADLNNDGKLEYILVNSSTQGDRIQSVFTIINKTLVETTMPSLGVNYTNILLPFIEHGKKGIQFNLESSFQIKAKSKKETSFLVSRRMGFIWRENKIEIVKDHYLCEELKCSVSQLQQIQLNKNESIKIEKSE